VISLRKPADYNYEENSLEKLENTIHFMPLSCLLHASFMPPSCLFHVFEL